MNLKGGNLKKREVGGSVRDKPSRADKNSQRRGRPRPRLTIMMIGQGEATSVNKFKLVAKVRIGSGPG